MEIKADTITFKSADGNTTFGVLNSDGESIRNEVEEVTVGENVSAGEYLYHKHADGKWWKAQANAEATSLGPLRMALESISADAAGTVLIRGIRTTTGLTAGAIYLSDTVAGGFLVSAPDSNGDVVRQIGKNLSTTQQEFDPSYPAITLVVT